MSCESVSSFTATSLLSKQEQSGVSKGSSAATPASGAACSCRTTTTTRAQIKTLENRICQEKRDREAAQRELRATSRELDLMEELLSRK